MGALVVISFEIIEGVTKFTTYQTFNVIVFNQYSHCQFEREREREKATCIQNFFSFFFPVTSMRGNYFHHYLHHT